MTNGGRRALCASSFCLRALYISSVSITTNLLTYINYKAYQCQYTRRQVISSSKMDLGRAFAKTCWSIPLTVGVFHRMTVRLHLRKRSASKVRLWSLLVPGIPLTRVI